MRLQNAKLHEGNDLMCEKLMEILEEQSLQLASSSSILPNLKRLLGII